MKVLGVSYGYHDASACLVVDGSVVAAAAEERFTRQKHDANFPAHAIAFCLGEGGLTTADLDQAVFHEDPHAKFSRVLCSAMAAYPDSRREFVASMKSWLGNKLWAVNTISSRLDLPPERITYLGHHFSHAVQAFMGSGCDEAAILVVDAVGDWGCSALFSGRWEDGAPRVERILEVSFPNSLGLVYSAVTAYLGFNPNDSECSTMALATFGKPRFVEPMREVIRAQGDGLYEVDQDYFNFMRFYRGPVTSKFVEVFGPPRARGVELPFRSFGASAEPSAEAQRLADVARSLQVVLEERVLGLCDKLHAAFPSKNLCFAGGVSLNCVSNQRVLAESPFERVFIPPDPGDGGTSVGTALYYAASHGDGAPERHRYGPYLGAEPAAASAVEIVNYVDPAQSVPYLKSGVTLEPGTRWKQETFKNRDALVEAVAQRLFDGAIVGWVQGRAELGPRALGNRSILIRPDRAELATRLSERVKERAAFRPYAFSVTEEDAPRALAVEPGRELSHRWMQFAAPVRAEVRAQLVAAIHADGTSRPQVCRREDNPAYHALLTAFGRRAGLAALLNTSFNPSGYPLVTTATEAMAMFARTDMDALVLGDTLVWKSVEHA